MKRERDRAGGVYPRHAAGESTLAGFAGGSPATFLFVVSTRCAYGGISYRGFAISLIAFEARTDLTLGRGPFRGGRPVPPGRTPSRSRNIVPPSNRTRCRAR